MTYKEAIEILKSNYPSERYTMLREAVDLSIKILEEKQDNPLLQIDKSDLVNMVCGIEPYYSVWDNRLVSDNGGPSGPRGDEWKWNICKLDECNKEQLIEIYTLCKKSWKKF